MTRNHRNRDHAGANDGGRSDLPALAIDPTVTSRKNSHALLASVKALVMRCKRIGPVCNCRKRRRSRSRPGEHRVGYLRNTRRPRHQPAPPPRSRMGRGQLPGRGDRSHASGRWGRRVGPGKGAQPHRTQRPGDARPVQRDHVAQRVRVPHLLDRFQQRVACIGKAHGLPIFHGKRYIGQPFKPLTRFIERHRDRNVGRDD
jgi:hypothetical protein